MSTTVRFLAPLLAALACGRALGQEVGRHEGLSLYGVATRAIAEEQSPSLEPRLRLYSDMRPQLRFGAPSTLPERPPRIGLELKLAPSPVQGLAHGTLLRTQLSESAHLSLRVRRNSIGVVLRSEF